MAAKDVGVNGIEALTSLSNLTLSNANYTLSGGSGAVTVTPASLSASLTGTVEKVYDGTIIAALTPANYGLSGVFEGDTVGLNSPVSGIYAGVNAGTGKLVSVTGVGLTGSGASNYVLTTPNLSAAVGVIDQRAVTVTANAETKQVSQQDPALSYQITNGTLVSGDGISGALVRQNGELQGSYDIEQGSVALSANYKLTFVDGTFSITNPPVLNVIQIPANGQSNNMSNSIESSFISSSVAQGPVSSLTSAQTTSQTGTQTTTQATTQTSGQASGTTQAAAGNQPANQTVNQAVGLGQNTGAPYPDNQFVSDTIHFRK